MSREIAVSEIAAMFREEEPEIFEAVEEWAAFRLMKGYSHAHADRTDLAFLDRMKTLLARMENTAPTIINDREERDAG